MFRSTVERLPELGPATKETHVQQSVEGVFKSGRLSAFSIDRLLDGPDEQPVSGRDVAVAVQEHERGRDCCLHRGREIWIQIADLLQNLRNTLQGAGQVGADIGGLSQPAAAVATVRAEFRGPSQ